MPDGFDLIDQYHAEKTPCFFVINFDKSLVKVYTWDELKKSNDILVQTPDFQNYNSVSEDIEFDIHATPISFEDYENIFNKIIHNIQIGNSYLTNLTFETPIQTQVSLKDIFLHAHARYKLYFKDQFICFSPESFIKIKNNIIKTFPMKGTIDASIPNAQEAILANEKEKAEHYTIVDLLRNDLSRVAGNVIVKKFRYIDKIATTDHEILQVSSEIEGEILTEYQNKLGTLLKELLPAGSISGAPKNKTISIINENENHQRGFYTGIFGIFDGTNVDTAVMIRFIENRDQQLFYKSGGGITIDSKAKDEYNEMKQKIYVPIF